MPLRSAALPTLSRHTTTLRSGVPVTLSPLYNSATLPLWVLNRPKAPGTSFTSPSTTDNVVIMPVIHPNLLLNNESACFIPILLIKMTLLCTTLTHLRVFTMQCPKNYGVKLQFFPLILKVFCQHSEFRMT